jgi:hypothetical protein
VRLGHFDVENALEQNRRTNSEFVRQLFFVKWSVS